MGNGNGGNGEVAVGERISPTVVAQLNSSEIDKQIDIAMRFPRNVTKCVDDAMSMATRDVFTAMGCSYQLKRGGKFISGPSARLGEIMGNCWRNLRVASRTIEIGDRDLVAQGVAHVLEKNSVYSVEVRRRIVDKNGRRYNEDMINMTANAANSIALRNAVFKVVPTVFVNQVMLAAQKMAVGDKATLVERRATMIEKFDGVGVDEGMVLEKLGRQSVEQITLGDLGALIGIYSAIEGGDTTVEQEFHDDMDQRPPEEKGKAPEKKPPAEKKQTNKQALNALIGKLSKQEGVDNIHSALKELKIGKALSKFNEADAQKAVDGLTKAFAGPPDPNSEEALILAGAGKEAGQ